MRSAIRCTAVCVRTLRDRRNNCEPRAKRTRKNCVRKRIVSAPKSLPKGSAKLRSSAATATPRSAEIYAKAYSRNAEFYAFYRSLQAYRTSIGTSSDVLVISPDSEFFKYLNRPNPR